MCGVPAVHRSHSESVLGRLGRTCCLCVQRVNRLDHFILAQTLTLMYLSRAQAVPQIWPPQVAELQGVAPHRQSWDAGVEITQTGDSMSVTKKVALAAAILAVAAAAIGRLAISGWSRPNVSQPMLIRGAIVPQDSDPAKQLPISDVEVTADDNLAVSGASSDNSGFFSLSLRPETRPGTPILLKFRNSDFKPLDLQVTANDEIYVAHMAPARQEVPNRGPEVSVTGVSVRYSVETTTAVNVGSAVKTFQIVNTGNVPCEGRPPCSPGMQWKAAIGSAMLDAGDGKEFRNARLSCIAGPCPFTVIESDNFSKGGRTIGASIRDWSDTTTFLLEADVFRRQVGNIIRQSYPVTINQAMNFTLPPSAEGASIEAKIDGSAIVFPLGPTPILSWANCSVRTTQDQARLFWCELKSGYRFP